MVSQPEVNYRASGRTAGGVNATMNPRSDGIVVGNLQDPATGRSSRTRPCASVTCRAAIEFFGAMRRPAAVDARLTRSVPPVVPPNVEAFFDSES